VTEALRNVLELLQNAAERYGTLHNRYEISILHIT